MFLMESVIEYFLFEREWKTSIFLAWRTLYPSAKFWELCPCKEGHRSPEAAAHGLMLLLHWMSKHFRGIHTPIALPPVFNNSIFLQSNFVEVGTIPDTIIMRPRNYDLLIIVHIAPCFIRLVGHVARHHDQSSFCTLGLILTYSE
jgi:hypothetical protein